MKGKVLMRTCDPAGPRHRPMIFLAAAIVLSVLCFARPPAGAETPTAGTSGNARAGSNWVGSWTASPQESHGVMPASLSNRTIRQTVRLTIGGNKVRIRLSNEFGTKPLLIGAASIALAGKNAETSDVVAASLRPLTFGGDRAVVIPAGAPAVSDPVAFDAAPLSDVTVNLYLPAATDLATVHATGLQTAYVSATGDFTASAGFPIVDRSENRLFLTGVIVEPAAPSRAVVAFGDSITDGVRSTVNANTRWPDVLARRLIEAGNPVAVLNQGISGNRVLSDGSGVSALARFERDALGQPGVTHVVILEGINDIGWTSTAVEPSSAVRTTGEIIAGYKQMIERAHLRGIKVIGSPLTPFESARGFFTVEKEAKRLAVNDWIRNSGAFDGLIDFDRAVADPAHPAAIAPAYDSGDHLHPNDAGYKAMGDAVDLKLFQ
jgi:lysophospholipase L1-like esterase